MPGRVEPPNYIDPAHPGDPDAIEQARVIPDCDECSRAARHLKAHRAAVDLKAHAKKPAHMPDFRNSDLRPITSLSDGE